MLDDSFLQLVKQSYLRTFSQQKTADELGVTKSKVRHALDILRVINQSPPEIKASDLPTPVVGMAIEEIELPEPSHSIYKPFVVDTPGQWGVIGDVHLPYHDLNTIKKWADECKQRNVKGILLNGDILDCYQLSAHHKDPTKARFREEIEAGKQLMKWLRSNFPNTRIIYKEGNHDDRLRRYIMERAPALFDIAELDMRVILGLDDLGIEWVADKRVIHLGKLSVIHGHEYRGSGGVNPARWLFLRAKDSTMCGHFHRSSEHPETTIRGKLIMCWSVGCACYLHPEYDPQANWGHGYAFVDIFQDGHYSVTNRKILRDGTVV